MAEPNWQKLTFDEAVAYFRAKLALPSHRWTDLWQEEHARSFVVAGVLKTTMLTDLKGAIDSAMAEGKSFAQWRDEFDSVLDKYGWEPEQGRAWRARVILETNLRVANAVGRWQQMTDPDLLALRPYLQYRHSGKRPGRPEHRAWDRLVLRADDPFWDTHAPPNGWGCGCHLVSLSARDLARLGKSGPDIAPPLEEYEWVDTTTGLTAMVPKGIDPGWAYNPGKAGGR